MRLHDGGVGKRVSPIGFLPQGFSHFLADAVVASQRVVVAHNKHPVRCHATVFVDSRRGSTGEGVTR